MRRRILPVSLALNNQIGNGLSEMILNAGGGRIINTLKIKVHMVGIMNILMLVGIKE